MSRPREPIIVRPRGSRPGSWRVWLRPECGLRPDVCAEWTERSLRTAPPLFLARVKWPRTQAAADRVGISLVEHLLAHDAATTLPQGPTVADYAKLFREAKTSPRARRLAAQGRPYSPTTLENYRQKIDDFIASDALLRKLHMGDVRRQDLEAFFSRVLDRVGPSRTLQDVWQILHLIFAQWCDDNRRQSPFRGMTKPSYQERVRGALTEGELVAIFSKPFPSPLERAICALAFWAGLRRGEVFALRWQDVDLERGRIMISRAVKQLERKVRSEGGTKGRKTRIVPLVAEARAALEELPRVDGYVISFPQGKRVGGHGKKVKRPNTGDWYSAMHGAMDRAGIDRAGRDITPHSARHSIASVMLARGVPKEIIKAILGHFDERTTDGYLHIAAEEIDKAGKGI
jgi:integrase